MASAYFLQIWRTRRVVALASKWTQILGFENFVLPAFFPPKWGNDLSVIKRTERWKVKERWKGLTFFNCVHLIFWMSTGRINCKIFLCLFISITKFCFSFCYFKLKKVLKGIKVEVTHGGQRRYKIFDITEQPTNQLRWAAPFSHIFHVCSFLNLMHWMILFYEGMWYYSMFIWDLFGKQLSLFYLNIVTNICLD